MARTCWPGAQVTMAGVDDRQPALFLSSTYYDLRQIRVDITEFVEAQLGYRLLASEFNAFPVDPSQNTIENCRKRVENDADLLVLLIGGRYGSVPQGASKSVTNMEYAAARSKGIPIFAFVDRSVLAVMPMWAANPNADFSSVVETSKVFEFATQVRDTDRVWTFPFETAQDIIRSLRSQLAYQMNRGLRLSRRLLQMPAAQELTGEALRIAVDRENGWPGLLLAQLLENEVAAAADLKRDHARQLALGIGEQVDEGYASQWFSSLSNQAIRIIDALKIIVEQVLNDAFNSTDIAALRYGARQIGRAYRDCLEWAARIRRAHVPNDWNGVAREQSRLLDNMMHEIESFGGRLRSEILRVLELPGEGTFEVNLTFHVTLGDMTAFNKELEMLKRKRGVA